MLFAVTPLFDLASADDLTRRVRRYYGLRALGLALSAVTVGGVWYGRGVPAWLWALMILYTWVWPHAAWALVRGRTDAMALNKRFLLGDAAVTGAWIALIGFNLLPSAVMATMIAITLIAMDGGGMLLRGMAALLAGCCVAACANGLVFAPHSDTAAILASLPLLTLFPMALGVIMHQLTQRVRVQNVELIRLGSTDDLSGLLNRSYWEKILAATFADHCCDKAVMLLIDIDHFKDINDRHGHTTGDEVIRQVGAVIRGSLREGDIAGRYGGDEFAVVLCNVDVQTASRIAERLGSEVARSLAGRVPELRCTLSIGLASGRARFASVREWVEAADAALYRAKLGGRNRFVVAD